METPEVGDLVFLLDKRAGNQHRGRARVVKVDGDRLHVIPIPRHRKVEIVRSDRVRVWRSEKVRRAALESRRGTRGSRGGHGSP